MKPQFALVLPTLREAGNIASLLARIRASLDPLGIAYEVIVVDDDSRDGIDAIVGEIARKDPRVKFLVRKGMTGLAGAVIFGWQRTGAEILGVMDADLQHPPELLPELLRAVERGADVAIGSRYVVPQTRRGFGRIRHLLSELAVLLTLPLQRRGLRVKDPMSGFFLVRRRAIDGVALERKGFKILLDVLVRGNVGSVLEIPFVFGRRGSGRSKAGMKIGARYLALLCTLWLYRKKSP